MNDFWNELDGAVQITIIGIVILGLALAAGLGLYRAFAVPYEDARRDAYEHSQSYVQGAIRDLGNLCIEISNADAAHVSLLRDTIRDRYVELDTRDIPEYLRPCVAAARGAN